MWVCARGCKGGGTGEARGMEMGERVPSGQAQMVLQNQTFKGTHWMLPAPSNPTTLANEALIQSQEEEKVAQWNHYVVHLRLI